MKLKTHWHNLGTILSTYECKVLNSQIQTIRSRNAGIQFDPMILNKFWLRKLLTSNRHFCNRDRHNTSVIVQTVLFCSSWREKFIFNEIYPRNVFTTVVRWSTKLLTFIIIIIKNQWHFVFFIQIYDIMTNLVLDYSKLSKIRPKFSLFGKFKARLDACLLISRIMIVIVIVTVIRIWLIEISRVSVFTAILSSSRDTCDPLFSLFPTIFEGVESDQLFWPWTNFFQDFYLLISPLSIDSSKNLFSYNSRIKNWDFDEWKHGKK